MKRTAFFISDRTGITAEMLGHSLLTQFEGVEFTRETIPFVDTPEKAQAVAQRIREKMAQDACNPIVFSTIINEELRQLSSVAGVLTVDFFQVFIGPLEKELHTKSSHTEGKSHGIVDFEEYKNRIDAINFAMNHDDGNLPKNLDEADVIVTGVSRSGKTPTCLYLALLYGIKAANYPLTPDDFGRPTLPKVLLEQRRKLFGLTIEPERLQHIRQERKPNSTYAALETCRFEVEEAEALMRHVGVPYLDTSTKSIEEIASTILQSAHLTRRIY
jgi:regulator of PEP synthase PpsR (kinase-PPPase family)